MSLPQTKPGRIHSTGARHEGRPGWRYGIIGPTESGKTTQMVRFVRLWMENFKEGLVFANYHLYDGTVDPAKDGDKPRILDPRLRIIKKFEVVGSLHRFAKKGIPVLLSMDEFSKYINSIQGFTSAEKLKILLDLASNLMKQDVEMVYTDQWPKALHTRVRTNVNRVFLPSYEESTRTVEYFYWPSIDHYLARDEISRQGPLRFSASEWFKYFDTKEIIAPKIPKFNPEKEAERIRRWAKREGVPIPEARGITDFLAFYQTKTNANWGRTQLGAVRFVLLNEILVNKILEKTNKKEEGKKGKENVSS